MAITGIAFITACSFTLRPSNSENKTEVSSNAKDLDVSMILNTMGISTKVDEAELNAKYPAVKMNTAADKGINLGFSNPMAQPYQLDVFDTEGNLVASVNNIISPSVTLSASIFTQGSYIYKLTGEGNTYAGKFFYQ